MLAIADFEAGDAADKFHILASGELVVHGGVPPPQGADASARPAAEGAGSSAQRVELGRVAPGEGFGESALLDRRATHTKSVTCATGRCEVVEILAADFMRLVEKSRVVRESFKRLHSRRAAHNERVLDQLEAGSTARRPA